MFIAVHEGYQDKLQDLQELAVSQGYWTAYYTNSKKPQKVSEILEEMRSASKIKPVVSPKKKAEDDAEKIRKHKELDERLQYRRR